MTSKEREKSFNISVSFVTRPSSDMGNAILEMGDRELRLTYFSAETV